MNKTITITSLWALAFLFSCTEEEPPKGWSLWWVQPEGIVTKVADFPEVLEKPISEQVDFPDFSVNFSLSPSSFGYRFFQVEATSKGKDMEGYFALKRAFSPRETPYNFNGVVDSSEMYRQSPHDVDAWIVEKIPMQAVPTVGVKSGETFHVAVSASPAMYDNFTTQEFDFEKGEIILASGDNGTSPGMQPDTVEVLDLDYNAEKTQVFSPGKVLAHYHQLSKENPVKFEGILFSTQASDLNELRKATMEKSANYFSKGKVKDYFGGLSFTTAYMNLRTNDSGKSNYWVVPAVEYANTQYGRDAFWIATMLEPKYSSECIASELQEVNHFAEYPLFAIIWAYRAFSAGMEVDLEKVQAYVDAVEERAKNNYYYSFWEGDGRLDFQYWGDVMAFEKDDVISYNQGLFALSMLVAEEMDLKIQSDPEKAVANYKGMFNEKDGYFPISQQKAVLGPDPLVPDLVAQVYVGRKLLDSEQVKAHYERMVNYSKTDYGFKIVASPDGSYLPAEVYDIEGYISQVNREKMPDGRYFRGGSYFLYDNLFLLDAYLHEIEGAEEMLKWRVGLDFQIGSTTYECLNTKTGEPWKPNMGWNVAVYAIWQKLIDEGKANRGLFDHIDQIVNNKTKTQ